jgi:galactoside O-acetyltransferase
MYEHLQFSEKGSDVILYPHIVFANCQNLCLKNNIIISEFVWIHGGIKTVIGNFIHISPFSSIAGGGVCILEDFVGLSAGVRIITGSEMVKGEGLTNPTIPTQFRAVSRSFVHLEKHVFLATNVIVHPGVTIGEGAVIGSNSVVTKDIKPWTINVGNPARAVAERSGEKIKQLEYKLYSQKDVSPLDVSEFIQLKKVMNMLPY